MLKEKKHFIYELFTYRQEKERREKLKQYFNPL